MYVFLGIHFLKNEFLTILPLKWQRQNFKKKTFFLVTQQFFTHSFKFPALSRLWLYDVKTSANLSLSGSGLPSLDPGLSWTVVGRRVLMWLPMDFGEALLASWLVCVYFLLGLWPSCSHFPPSLHGLAMCLTENVWRCYSGPVCCVLWLFLLTLCVCLIVLNVPQPAKNRLKWLTFLNESFCFGFMMRIFSCS